MGLSFCEARKRTRRSEDDDCVSPTPKRRSSIKSRSGNNEYGGYTCENADNTSEVSDNQNNVPSLVERIHPSKMSPETFFHKFISLRKPCVLLGHPPFRSASTVDEQGANKQKEEEESKLSWPVSLETLMDAAGNQLVQVERRFDCSESFGQARTKQRQITMPFGSFLKIATTMEDNNAERDIFSGISGIDKGKSDPPLTKEMLYLSTQEYSQSDSDQHAVVGVENETMVVTEITPPCQQLIENGLIPNRIPLMGNLILHACNFWMGSVAAIRNQKGADRLLSSLSSSSGLHHDYHDNLYILLRGRKRFRLYSPDMAHRMFVHGTIHKVYCNGLISYEGFETREDGVPLALLDAQQEDCDVEVGEGGQDGSVEDGDEKEDHIFGKGADYSSSDSDGGGKDVNWELEGADDFDAIEGISSTGEKIINTKADESENVATDKTGAKPLHFSKVLPQDLRDIEAGKNFNGINEKFPGFVECPFIDVELTAGESLYLPAGWFHEVRSMGCKEQLILSNTAEEGKDEVDPFQNCHVAINYWYYPPDDIKNFSQPYKSNFLGKLYSRSCSLCQKGNVPSQMNK